MIQAFDFVANAIVHTIELPAYGWQLQRENRTLFVTSMIANSLFRLNLTRMKSLIPFHSQVRSQVCQISDELYLAMAEIDMIGRLNLNMPSAFELVPVGTEFKDDQGNPYANSNVNSVACDPLANRIYVSRGADNMIGVFEADSLEQIGLIPTGSYPNEIELDPMDARLWIAEGKGGPGRIVAYWKKCHCWRSSNDRPFRLISRGDH